MTPDTGPRLRIGELSRRTGVRADTLRAWERRYGLLRPERTDGGFRLYGSADEARVRAMTARIEAGVSAAEAARLTVSSAPMADAAGDGATEGEPLTASAGALRVALEAFDDSGANAVLDEALSRLTLEAVAEGVILPAMRQIGNRWESGEISIAQEHFATGVIRGRLLSVARNWGAGTGPLALLACPPGESHDLGLISFGLVLHSRGWRITYLGADTPIDTISQAVGDLHPDAIVLAALDPAPFESAAEELSALASAGRVLIAGAGASPELAQRLGARVLDEDPVGAARQLNAT
ncbi:MAG TPA: B12-binding domain-containing protein [Solirubrobacterales bacterium]|nr:B12-binding domain-containing protein [Solirubrobacterales bacterium]